MNRIGFIGAYDKIDLIIYIAKLISELGKKVLIIDATKLQKAKYIVPAIAPAKSYVTNFENIDVAVGFEDYNSIKDYLGIPLNAVLEYDYILLDIDSEETLESLDIKTATKNYFITGFDLYSLKRGLEIFSNISEPMALKKVLFSNEVTKADEDYINYISLGYKVIWDNEEIYFPLESGDQTTIIENQRIAKVKLKKLTKAYKDSLLYITDEILENFQESNNLKRVFKQLEKGV